MHMNSDELGFYIYMDEIENGKGQEEEDDEQV